MTSLTIPPSLSSNTFPHKLTFPSPPQHITLSSNRTRATSTTTTSTSSNSRQLSFKTTPFSTLYDTLGIPIGATTHEIKSAYRKLARVCHPDVERNSSSGEEFMRIHAAYATLSDPQKREDYDRMIFRRRISLSSSSPSSAGISGGGYGSRRNWETDQCW